MPNVQTLIGRRRGELRLTVIDTLKILSRQGLLLFPVVAGSFLMIAGGLGADLGLPNLFRELPNEFDRPQTFLNALRSASCQTQAFATALMGLMWTVFLLINEIEKDPESTQPVGSIASVMWPGVVILALLQLAAGQIKLSANIPEPTLATFLNGVLGTLLGLVFVAITLKLTMLLSERTGYPQLTMVWILTALILSTSASFAWLMPSSAIFIAIAWFVLAYVVLDRTPRVWRFPLLLGILALIVVGQLPERKAQIPGLDPAASLAAKYTRAAAPSQLLEPTKSFDRWAARQSTRAPGVKPKFVVVAASGGAYRASYWTALVLDHLVAEEAKGLAGFSESVRLITGASGGMVGAGHFVAREDRRAGGPKLEALIDADLAKHAPEGSWSGIFKNARRDSLTTVVQALIQCDFWSLFWPFDLHVYPCTQGGGTIAYDKGVDRGIALERQWPALAARTFASLAAGEADGGRPSIILSPVLVPSGRPLLISNLDLSEMRTENPDTVELFHLMPGAQETFTLATAVRLNATFPYISPGVTLPVATPDTFERVVDASYRDNDGISIATAFLTGPRMKAWLTQNTSGVILVQINAFASQSTPACVRTFGPPESPAEPDFISSWLDRATVWLTTPLEGLLASRAATSGFANRQQIRLLESAFPKDFFSHIEFSNRQEAGYNWFLPQSDLEQMRGQIATPNNRECLETLKSIWARP